MKIIILGWKRWSVLKLFERVLEERTDEDILVSLDGGCDPDLLIKLKESIANLRGVEICVKEKNLGIKGHVLSLVDHLQDVESFIVLEDDIWPCKGFIEYAKKSLLIVPVNSSINQISLYSFRFNEFNRLPFTPYYGGNNNTYIGMQVPSSWGFVMSTVWFRDFVSWQSSKFENDITDDLRVPKEVRKWGANSWKKYFVLYQIEKNKHTLYPAVSFSTIIPDDEGFHTKSIAYDLMTPLGNLGMMNFNKIEELVLYDAWYEIIPECLGLSGSITTDIYGQKPVEYLSLFSYVLTLERPKHFIRSYFINRIPVAINLVEESLECNDNKSGHYVYLAKTKDVRKIGLRNIQNMFLLLGFKIFSYKFLKNWLR